MTHNDQARLAPGGGKPAKAADEENSLSAAADETVEELAKRRDEGGHAGFGDIG